MINPTEKDIGRFVVFKRNTIEEERGRIKRLSSQEQSVHVVYKCDGNWNAYENYTSESTGTDYLEYLY